MSDEYKPPANAEEALDRFLEQFQKAQNIASDVSTPTKVKARVYKQMGIDCLVARCPVCGTVAGLDGEGKHLCRHCHTWLQYCRE